MQTFQTLEPPDNEIGDSPYQDTLRNILSFCYKKPAVTDYISMEEDPNPFLLVSRFEVQLLSNCIDDQESENALIRALLSAFSVPP